MACLLTGTLPGETSLQCLAPSRVGRYLCTSIPILNHGQVLRLMCYCKSVCLLLILTLLERMLVKALIRRGLVPRDKINRRTMPGDKASIRASTCATSRDSCSPSTQNSTYAGLMSDQGAPPHFNSPCPPNAFLRHIYFWARRVSALLLLVLILHPSIVPLSTSLGTLLCRYSRPFCSCLIEHFGRALLCLLLTLLT
jgi:hypothetical protein